MQNHRDTFLKLALQTGIISVSEGKVKFDQTFHGAAGILRLAANACREIINNPLNGLHEAKVLFSFGYISYELPLLTLTGQEFRGGDGKSFVHYDVHRWYDCDFLRGKKVIVLSVDDEDLSFPEAHHFINDKYGGDLLGFVTLFSRRDDEFPPLPVFRLLCEEDVIQEVNSIQEVQIFRGGGSGFPGTAF